MTSKPTRTITREEWRGLMHAHPDTDAYAKLADHDSALRAEVEEMRQRCAAYEEQLRRAAKEYRASELREVDLALGNPGDRLAAIEELRRELEKLGKKYEKAIAHINSFTASDLEALPTTPREAKFYDKLHAAEAEAADLRECKRVLEVAGKELGIDIEIPNDLITHVEILRAELELLRQERDAARADLAELELQMQDERDMAAAIHRDHMDRAIALDQARAEVEEMRAQLDECREEKLMAHNAWRIEREEVKRLDEELRRELARQRSFDEGHPAMCCNQCAREAADLREELRQAREALGALEWSSTVLDGAAEAYDACPVCGSPRFRGHRGGCVLDAVLTPRKDPAE